MYGIVKKYGVGEICFEKSLMPTKLHLFNGKEKKNITI